VKIDRIAVMPQRERMRRASGHSLDINHRNRITVDFNSVNVSSARSELPRRRR
jgi:hypothetical protein